MGRIRVYVADWQVIFRKGIRFSLSRVEDIEVVGDTGSNKEALKLIESNPPDVAILNINDCKPSGIQITRTIKQNLPSVSVILVMDYPDDEHYFSAMKSGASACISKDIHPEHLVSIVRDIAGGVKPISKALLKTALAQRVLAIENLLTKLSADEVDILIRAAKGTSGELTAAVLGMSEGLLDSQLASILSKLTANKGLVSKERLFAKPRSGSTQRWVAKIKGGTVRTSIKNEPILAAAGKMPEAPQPTVIQPAVPEEVAAETSIDSITLQKDKAASALEEPESVRPDPTTDLELNLKAQLVGFLRSRGYKVEESAKVKGKSGVVRCLDILASRDDLIVQHHIGIGVFTARAGGTEVPIYELLNFRAKAEDLGIHNLIVVAVPRLSLQAQSLAQAQQIKVLTAEDIAKLSPGQSWLTSVTEMAGASRGQLEVSGNTPAKAALEVARPADLRKVLWIEKDLASSIEFARVLKIAGFEVMTFVNPYDGLQKVNEASLVVLDDELSCAKQVFSQIRKQSSVPIILIGSKKGEELRDGTESMRADAYLRRSISGRELVARIRAILRRCENIE